MDGWRSCDITGKEEEFMVSFSLAGCLIAPFGHGMAWHGMAFM